MKLRSTISLFLCAALAAAFVGCGASDASASKPDAGPAAAFDPIANNGKEIVMAIGSANNDRVATMRGEVWPNKGKWQDSNAYFAKLMGAGGRGPVVERIHFRCFSDGGVTIATDAEELKRKGNVWTMLAGIGRCPDSRTPFLWTRNLRLTQADLEAYARNPDAERSLAARLDPSTDCVVMITKGGAVFEIKAPKLTTKAFFGGVELDPSAVEIVEALPD